ncbi:hypothetical protein TcasGA2_TC009009 [Tribolium castaneum]|uniref:Neuropeptide-like 4 n=1 Tax=Tribolium castaneum TaxID=7070 RepID=D6WPW9_TRICA|nr:hypothetical protein TcasGA2_TC009009 [Tribolium castaneum]
MKFTTLCFVVILFAAALAVPMPFPAAPIAGPEKDLKSSESAYIYPYAYPYYYWGHYPYLIYGK